MSRAFGRRWTSRAVESPGMSWGADEVMVVERCMRVHTSTGICMRESGDVIGVGLFEMERGTGI